MADCWELLDAGPLVDWAGPSYCFFCSFVASFSLYVASMGSSYSAPLASQSASMPARNCRRAEAHLHHFIVSTSDPLYFVLAYRRLQLPGACSRHPRPDPLSRCLDAPPMPVHCRPRLPSNPAPSLALVTLSSATSRLAMPPSSPARVVVVPFFLDDHLFFFSDHNMVTVRRIEPDPSTLQGTHFWDQRRNERQIGFFDAMKNI